jgi:flagellar FliL protein
MIIIGVLALLMLVGGAAGGYFGGAMFAPPKPKKPEAAVVEDKNKVPDASLFYDLPELLVTIQDPDNGVRVLQLSTSIECPSQDDLDKLKAYLPRVLDVFQIYMSTLTVKDLRGVKNIETLRGRLRDRISAAIAPGKVKNVLFRNIRVQ